MKGESVAYPMFEDNGLTVDQRYKEIQKQGLLKVKLPYGEPCWLATRYADVRTVYGDRRFGRVLGLNRDAPGVWPGALAKNPTLLLNMDPPEHTRLRRLTAETFSPRRIERMAGWVQRLVDELLDDMVAQGKPADFVSVFSSNLPVRVLLRILGVPETEAGEFRSMVDRATALDADAQTREEAQQRTVAHIKGLIAERRARHRDDLLSELVDARDQGDRLSEEELISLCMALWHGGFKT